MKKITMMVAAMGMFGGALADQTTVIQPVTADVKNVCTYNTPDRTDVKDQTFPESSQTPVNIGEYRANKSSTTVGTTPRGGDSNGGFLYVFHCTKNTPFNSVTYSDFNGTASSTNTSGSITLKDSAGNKLTANFTATTQTYADGTPTPRGDQEGGDYHYSDATFSIPGGQYSAPAGSYAGKLVVTINYN
ncbi:hypothetical protein [Deinococcus sp.]|uniref:hypothetical protein n=1 Tax=Deinococcus sp. TaxID=47478 RepID=UPI003C7E2E9C